VSSIYFERRLEFLAFARGQYKKKRDENKEDERGKGSLA